MASVAPRNLKIGTIIDKTLGVVERAAVPSLVYFIALTVLDGAIGYFGLTMTAPLQAVSFALLKTLVGVVCAYLLLDAMVRRTGLRSRGEGDVFLPYFALSILYTLGVIGGFILLVFPGLFVMARWSIAQPLLIARGDGVMQSLGESWERTKDNEFQILAALLLFLVPTIAISVLCTIMLGRASVAGMIISQVASSASSVLALAMGVALYGLVIGAQQTLATKS
jgi:membrane-anchored glycerophosphoryl diester phosphodiesterase (GDPDase)